MPLNLLFYFVIFLVLFAVLLVASVILQIRWGGPVSDYLRAMLRIVAIRSAIATLIIVALHLAWMAFA